MSWEQHVILEDEIKLLEKITGLKARDLLLAEMEKHKLYIVQREKIVSDVLPDAIPLERVFLSDGRSFEPKCVRVDRYDDAGHDFYAWCDSQETPEVETHYHSGDDIISDDPEQTDG